MSEQEKDTLIEEAESVEESTKPETDSEAEDSNDEVQSEMLRFQIERHQNEDDEKDYSVHLPNTPTAKSCQGENRLEAAAAKIASYGKVTPAMKAWKTFSGVANAVGGALLLLLLVVWPYVSLAIYRTFNWIGNPVWTAIVVSVVVIMCVASVVSKFLEHRRTHTLGFGFWLWTIIKVVVAVSLCALALYSCSSGVEQRYEEYLATISDSSLVDISRSSLF